MVCYQTILAALPAVLFVDLKPIPTKSTAGHGLAYR
jgi:hypothetical protein